MGKIETLSAIQAELKAPKNQTNKFGGYNYRNCEDILEAVKPILTNYASAVTLNDEIVVVGDRYYVKATATLITPEGEISTTAYAREALDKKGMDDSQLTGATSSYARKYALNGLFAIDDTKDADSEEKKPETPKAANKPAPAPKPAAPKAPDDVPFPEVVPSPKPSEDALRKMRYNLIVNAKNKAAARGLIIDDAAISKVSASMFRQSDPYALGNDDFSALIARMNGAK